MFHIFEDQESNIPCFPQHKIEVSIIASHPKPVTIDIMAMTPKILKDRKDELYDAMRNGAQVHFLLTNGTAALIWNEKQRSFAEKLDEIQAFKDDLDEVICDHFYVKIVDWSPSVGMIMINKSSADALALISIYTADPEVSSGEKACMLLQQEAGAELLTSYTKQYRALWQRGKTIDWQERVGHLERVAVTMKENTRKAIWNIEKSKNMDMAFVIALPEEFRHFREVFAPMKKMAEPGTGQTYYKFQCGNFSCLVLLLGRMCKETSAQMTERMLRHYNVGTVVSIGIAGSAKSDDISEGDVAIATQVIDFFHRSKVRDETSKRSTKLDFKILTGGAAYQTSQQLVSWIMHMEFSHPEIFREWRELCNKKAKTLFENLGAAPRNKAAKAARARLFDGRLHADDVHVATLDMVASSKNFVKWLQESDRNISVIEMESSGVVHAVAQNLPLTRCLVVKGISDLADAKKSETDVVFAGKNRQVAMVNASFLVKTLLENGLLPLGSEECPAYMGNPSS